MVDEPKLMSGGGTRCSPRVVVSLPVEVDVSGQKRQLNLISKDIGGGGIFLRTSQPAPLWSKVKISLTKPDGKLFQLSGEVVRSVTMEKSQESGHPAGMAVAFDESSRNKKKELVAIVLELCSQRDPTPKAKAEPPRLKAPPDTPIQKIQSEVSSDEESDKLLDEIDKLLDSVEIDMEESENDLAFDIEVSENHRVPEVTPAPKTPNVSPPRAATKPEPRTPIQPSRAAPVPPAPKTPITTKPKFEKSPQDQHFDMLRHYLTEYKRTRRGSTYYHVLGIAKQASSEQIEKAYQHLLQKLRPQCSPDLLPADLLQELTEVLGRIRKAFAILSKPDRRDAYDFLIETQ